MKNTIRTASSGGNHHELVVLDVSILGKHLCLALLTALESFDGGVEGAVEDSRE